MMALPKALNERLIVIDDIERKNASLCVDEVLGLIDECKNQYKCRFLLILNDDQLNDQPSWETFREKVVDGEVRLTTTSAESTAIAASIVCTPYLDRILATLRACGVANIRVICKVIRAVNEILDGRPCASSEILDRVIPSVVLLASAHYKGIDNPPSLDHVRNASSAMIAAFRRTNDDAGQLTDEQKSQQNWIDWLERAGIQATDELEVSVVEFLRTGVADAGALNRILDGYESDRARLATRNLATSFIENVLWSPKLTDAELLAQAEAIVPHASVLDANLLTSVSNEVSALNGGGAVATRLIDAWITGFEAAACAAPDDFNWLIDDVRHRPVHPRIGEAIDGFVEKSKQSVSVLQACTKMMRDQAWGDAETYCLRNSTTQMYYEAITQNEGRNLRILMSRLLSITQEEVFNHPMFGDCGARFSEACRLIRTEEPDSRLSTLIVILFKNKGLEGLLDRID